MTLDIYKKKKEREWNSVNLKMQIAMYREHSRTEGES